VRIVLDTNILVRANPKAAQGGLARELLLIASSEPHFLVLSEPILIEVRRVLHYPHVQKRWPMSKDSIDAYVASLEAVAHMVDMPAEVPAVVSDPDDDPILQTAVFGQAHVLCMRDSAFRSKVVEEVCRSHGIRVLV